MAEVQAGRISPQHAAILFKHEQAGNPLGEEEPAAQSPQMAPPATNAQPGGLAPTQPALSQPAPSQGPSGGLAPQVAQAAQAAPAPQMPARPAGPPPPDMGRLTNKDYSDFMAGSSSLVPKGQSDESRLMLAMLADRGKTERTGMTTGSAEKVAGVKTKSAEGIAGSNILSREKIASESNANRLAIAELQAAVRNNGIQSHEGKQAQQQLVGMYNTLTRNLAGIISTPGIDMEEPAVAQQIQDLQMQLSQLEPYVQQQTIGQQLPKVSGQPLPTPKPKPQAPGLIDSAKSALGFGQPSTPVPAPAPAPAAAPQRIFRQGRWWTRGPNGEAVPE